ncbi:MAG: lytic transglycosylase domain-containing protein [Pseudomonadota bacterium]
MRHKWFLLCLAFSLFMVVPAAAATDKANMALCRNAAIQAADRYGVPRAVMIAITLVETRTKRSGVSGAWPWTVNVAGKGFWFDSRAAALIHAQRTLAKGKKSFDVGCFQLNYKWHGKHFNSIDHMFEPGPSGAYAARFVKDLHRETGDWIKASGLYHSRTPKHSKRYRKLVARTIARMDGKVPQPTQVAAADQQADPVTRQRVFRVNGQGGLFPVESRGQIRGPQNRRTAGSVGTLVLRRGKGGLITVNRLRTGG